MPPASWLPRIAPTEEDENHHLLRGVVHDPTARRMGGVAGHAGIFSTADDLAIFAQALLDGGRGVLTPATVAKMTSPQQPVNGHGAARIWVGHRFSFLYQPRGIVAGGRLRAYRIHGNFAVDRSGDEDLYRAADQRGAHERAASEKRREVRFRCGRKVATAVAAALALDPAEAEKMRLASDHRLQRNAKRGAQAGGAERDGEDRD